MYFHNNTKLCYTKTRSRLLSWSPSWFITENSDYAKFYYWNKEIKYQQLSCLDFTHSLTLALSISTNWLTEAPKAWVFDCMSFHDYWQSRLSETVFSKFFSFSLNHNFFDFDIDIMIWTCCQVKSYQCIDVTGWHRNIIRYLHNL